MKAGSPGKVEGVVGDLVESWVHCVADAHKADVGSLDVEVPGVRHAQVQLRHPEEHAVGPVVAQGIGNCAQAHVGGVQDVCSVLEVELVGLFVLFRIGNDGGGAEEGEKVVGLHEHVIADCIIGVDIGNNFDMVVVSYTVAQLQSCNHCPNHEIVLHDSCLICQR